MQAERRTVTRTRHEWALRSPVVFAEVQKAIDLAVHHLPENRRGWDDSLTAEARDDEIVIYWEEITDG